MFALVITVAIIFSLFSTAIMSYIAMAVPIGPWIEATLVLLGSLIFRFVIRTVAKEANAAIALAVAAGGIGGIAATACAFSFPTLYFLSPELFNSWLASPWYFSALMGGLVLAAGGFGILMAQAFEKSLVIDQKLPFAVGAMVHKMISAQNQIRKAGELIIGFLGTIVVMLLQNSWFGLRALIPPLVTVFQTVTYKFCFWFFTNTPCLLFSIPTLTLRFELLPMLIAVGYITGHSIALPLVCGTISKIVVLGPLNHALFSTIKQIDFELAFVSGMVLQGALVSLLDMPKLLRNTYKNINKAQKEQNFFVRLESFSISWIALALVLIVTLVFLFHLNFSLLAQLYLIIGTLIWTYQMCVFAGRFGIAPLGRFGTFLMVPGILLFGVNPVYATIMAAFVEICGGVASDALFSLTVANLMSIKSSLIRRYQWLGLGVTVITIGILFWLLITSFGLGTPQLFCQKAQARALLLSVQSFNPYILALGGFFGYILKKLSLNPALVLGGILMPLDYSLGLIIGGLLTYLLKNTHEWTPFWSGVFAANSIWMILKTVL